MITESHLSVKKGTKAIYSIIEFIIRAAELFSKEIRKPALTLPWQCAGQPLAPLLDTPILGKVSLLRLGSQGGDRVTLSSC